MELTECMHGIYPSTSCTYCYPKAKGTTSRTNTRVICARYDGQCPACNLPITADQSYITQDETGRWVHEHCT